MTTNLAHLLVLTKLKFIFAPPSGIMVGIAQLVRALVCGTRGRGFKSHYPPKVKGLAQARPFFVEQYVASLLAKVFAKAKKRLRRSPLTLRAPQIILGSRAKRVILPLFTLDSAKLYWKHS